MHTDMLNKYETVCACRFHARLAFARQHHKYGNQHINLHYMHMFEHVNLFAAAQLVHQGVYSPKYIYGYNNR
jgi:hypothetical protein